MASAAANRARAAIGAESPWKEVVVDGVRLAYDDEGRGDPLVCLHAVAHGARDFENLRGQAARNAARDRARLAGPRELGRRQRARDRRPLCLAPRWLPRCLGR